MTSILRPSKANVWLNCPGSVALSESVPEEEESEAAREGTLAHAYAATLLAGESPTISDDEMREAVDFYVATVRSFGVPTVEQHVRCEAVYPGIEGTPDAWLIVGEVLHIFDFKYGHKYVEVEDNPQLLCYAAGLLASMCKQYDVHLHIIQPRCYGIDPHRICTLSWKEATEAIRKLTVAVLLALSPEPDCTPGDYCYGCPARRHCGALQQSCYRIVEVTQALFENALTLDETGRELSVLKRAADLLKIRIDSLTPIIENALRAGGAVRGWSLEATQGRTKWTVPDEEIIALGAAMDINLTRIGVITPAQALTAKFPEDVVKAFCARESGAAKLVPFKPIRSFK